MKIRICIALELLLHAALFAQPPLQTIPGDPNGATQSAKFYDANGNLQYKCEASSLQKLSLVTVSAASNANPASFTATSHGFYYSSTSAAKPVVFISGGTGNWAGVNGMWIATVTGANTFTIPVDSSAFGSFTGQSLTIVTRAPKTSQGVWRIHFYSYDANGNPEWDGWPSASNGSNQGQLGGGSSSYTFICDNRAFLAYQ